MVPRICEVKVLDDYRLWLEFEDGKKGEVNLKDELWGEVFEPLLDPLVFRQVKLDPELKTLSWANGADFAPEFLYECIRS